MTSDCGRAVGIRNFQPACRVKLFRKKKGQCLERGTRVRGASRGNSARGSDRTRAWERIPPRAWWLWGKKKEADGAKLHACHAEVQGTAPRRVEPHAGGSNITCAKVEAEASFRGSRPLLCWLCWRLCSLLRLQQVVEKKGEFPGGKETSRKVLSCLQVQVLAFLMALQSPRAGAVASPACKCKVEEEWPKSTARIWMSGCQFPNFNESDSEIVLSI